MLKIGMERFIAGKGSENSHRLRQMFANLQSKLYLQPRLVVEAPSFLSC